MDIVRFEKIINKTYEYNNARGWHPTPQDIAKSIVIEGAELLEHFQWDSEKILTENKLEGKDLKEIKYEVADVLWYLLSFCKETNIDIAEALELKYIHNEEKYPVEMIKGQNGRELYFAQKKKYRQDKKSS